MSAHNEHKRPGYAALQEGVDNLVLEFGLPQAIRMIDGLYRNTTIIHKAARRYELIKDYIIGEAVLIFDLDEKDLFKNNIRECREARMACYHILSKYVKDSHSGIASAFGRKRSSVLYFIHKCNEILSLPENYKGFLEKYKALESATIRFITNLK
ncbi:MAG: hypothetical protein KDD04_02610 [Sinomicrobium sp.]|nr:hypothetical protein [Sinomicrobium sp.]